MEEDRLGGWIEREVGGFCDCLQDQSRGRARTGEKGIASAEQRMVPTRDREC